MGRGNTTDIEDRHDASALLTANELCLECIAIKFDRDGPGRSLRGACSFRPPRKFVPGVSTSPELALATLDRITLYPSHHRPRGVGRGASETTRHMITAATRAKAKRRG